MKVIVKILQWRKIRAFPSFHSLILTEKRYSLPFYCMERCNCAVTSDVKDFNFT